MKYNTKLTVEVDITTQFGPEDAVKMIEVLFMNVPAIKSATVVGLETDYESLLDKGFPKDTNSLVMKNIPIKIK